MGSYNLPRDTKGEGRILYVFSTKALMYTGIGAAIGLVPNFIFGLFNMTIAGYVSIAILGFIGFSIATFKVPKTTAFKITRIAGGEKIDETIKRMIKFKKEKNKLYVYTEEESKAEKPDETKEKGIDKILGGLKNG